MIVKGISWKSPLDVGVIEGHILGTHVRLAASGYEIHGKRYHIAPTVLTEKLADEVSGPFAYAMDVAAVFGFKTEEQVDDFMASDCSDNFMSWLNANEHKVLAARERLQQLVGKFTCYG